METFGKYKLTERLAIGGMAEVFRATVHGEAGFAKPVVIKRLHPRLSSDVEFVNMLIDEARITSMLTHSNICQVLDLGSVDGSYYIAMEHIAGEDLRTVHDNFIRNGTHMPVDAALYVISEMLAGLHYAHNKEGPDGEPLHIIHRDVSPQNVLLSFEGEVKVIDFGIAKARTRMVHTQAGVIKGKFRYMSPEQASGGNIDHRTDVFAAGIVLYELLSGGPHLVDVPDTEVLRRMRDARFEPLWERRPDLPRPLTDLVHEALSKRPRKRYQSAADFRDAIVGYMRQTGSMFGRAELAELMQQRFSTKKRRTRASRAPDMVSRERPPAPRAPRDATAQVDDDDIELIVQSEPARRARVGAGSDPSHRRAASLGIGPAHAGSEPHANGRQDPYARTAHVESAPGLRPERTAALDDDHPSTGPAVMPA
ncbi:MAG: serine/threonine protein kinase, partial [Myxococcales bacterium]|nr:serine/threonine protein kinase [Myxococcales bacterium]